MARFHSGLDDNPLATLVLSENMAATPLAGTVAVAGIEAIKRFCISLEGRLDLATTDNCQGIWEFALTGPSWSLYTVLASHQIWRMEGRTWGTPHKRSRPSIPLYDAEAGLSRHKFYRLRALICNVGLTATLTLAANRRKRKLSGTPV